MFTPEITVFRNEHSRHHLLLRRPIMRMLSPLAPSRVRRSFTTLFGLIALAAFPRSLAACEGCGCLETCRQTFGGLRYAKGTLMLLHSCWVADGNIYCVYQEWQ
jgi:hypothetical protein